MKLLFDATELSYYNEKSGHRGGVFYVALNLLRELQKKDVDITFICDYRRLEFLKRIKEFKDIPTLKEHSFINRLWGIIFYLIKNFPIRIKYGFLILSRYYDAYLYKINTKNLENINKFDAYFSPFTPPCKEVEAANIKRFRMIHDIIPILDGGTPKSTKDWYYKIYTTINKDDFYVTNSENTRKDVISNFELSDDNVKTTLLGANNNFCASEEKSPIEGKYVFSLCTLGKRKNLEFGIKSFFEFIKRNNINDLKIVLGGSIWKKYSKELKSAIKNFDKSKIIFTGYIEEKELAKYYSNALCFIYPSLYEGFGLPVLEAMQCGCPVITSNVSSLPEVIGNCGIQINPKSDEEMIKAYEKMYFDTDFRKKCKQKGIERAKQFNWEKCASEIISYISKKTSNCT